MNKILFKQTDDGSIGLYDSEVKDIYHSKTGALTEAKDKFINPFLTFEDIKNKTDLKVLDICYGVGYNSKALKSILRGQKISITALDLNKDLIAISPLLKDGINDDELKLDFLSDILNLYENITEYQKVIKKYITTDTKSYFNQNIVNLIDFIEKEGYVYTPNKNKEGFLHNIYYRYISNSINNNLKYASNNDFCICFKINDVRKSIFELQETYDIVFLDGFSPQIAPALWTIDFFKQLKTKINSNSIILTYSKSTAVRKSFLDLGFYVGKTFINQIDMGSVFSLNKDFIINPLTNYDIDLLNTTSGIPYRDTNFSLSNLDIIKNREQEQKNSNLISHTKFLKLNK